MRVPVFSVIIPQHFRKVNPKNEKIQKKGKQKNEIYRNYTLTAKKSLLGNTLTVTLNDDGAIKIVGDTTDEETQTVA